MRILHVLDHGLPLQSGYTFRTRAIMKAQIAGGHDVAAVTGPRQGDGRAGWETVDGLRFFRTGAARPSGLVGEAKGLRDFARVIAVATDEHRPDVIHAHSPVLGALAAGRVARARGVPLVYEIRAFWEDAAVGNGTGVEGSWRYRATKAVETWVARRADAVAVICEGLRGDLVARGIDPGKIVVSPNGVDLTLFGTPAARDDGLAAALGLVAVKTRPSVRAAPVDARVSEDDVRSLSFDRLRTNGVGVSDVEARVGGEGPPDVIGFIGSFYPYEGLDDLIAAMPALVAARPGARLLLVGGGPAEAALRAQAGASPVADRIVFAGRVPHEEVERYYGLVDVLAYPRKAMRLTELVTPLKPLEAMAQGRLVAASDVGGHRELIADGVTGTLFPAGDPAGIAAALAGLLDDRDGWDARRKAGRAFVELERNWSSNIRRYDPVYQRLVEAARRNRRWSASPVPA